MTSGPSLSGLNNIQAWPPATDNDARTPTLESEAPRQLFSSLPVQTPEAAANRVSPSANRSFGFGSPSMNPLLRQRSGSMAGGNNAPIGPFSFGVGIGASGSGRSPSAGGSNLLSGNSTGFRHSADNDNYLPAATHGSNEVGANPLLARNSNSFHSSGPYLLTDTANSSDSLVAFKPSGDAFATSSSLPFENSLAVSNDFGLRQRSNNKRLNSDIKEPGMNGRKDITQIALPPPKASLMSMSFGITALDKKSKSDSFRGKPDSSQFRQDTNKFAPVLNKAATAHELVLPPNNRKNDYANWVVVYGFTSYEQYNTILLRFDTYGTILSRYPDGSSRGNSGDNSAALSTLSNWVCLQYETRLQAEKALCQHESLLDAGAGSRDHNKRGELVIVGVMRVDATVARKLGLAVGPEGTLEGGNTTSFACATGIHGNKLSGTETGVGKLLLREEDVLLMDGATKQFGGGHFREYGDKTFQSHRVENSICERVMSWVFSW